MDWAGIRAGLQDELEKIAAFSLQGLSPETVMEKSIPPPPMETPGFSKARDILERASQAQVKTAAKASKSSKKVQQALPQQLGLGKMVNQGDDSLNEKAKSVAGYGLAGLGTGGALHKAYSSIPSVHESVRHHSIKDEAKWLAEAKLNNIGNKLMVGGALVGLGYGANRLRQKAKAKTGTITKTATLTTPGQSLKASKQVGSLKTAPSLAGPSTTSQIRGQFIGKKGIP